MAEFIAGGLLVLFIVIFVIRKTKLDSQQRPPLRMHLDMLEAHTNSSKAETPENSKSLEQLSDDSAATQKETQAQGSQALRHTESATSTHSFSPERRAALEQKRRELFGKPMGQMPTVHEAVPNRQLPELLPNQFVILDLETTGLNPYVDEIIEIGAIKVTLDATQHPTFQVLVKPSVKLPRKIVEITGITQAMIDAGGIAPSDALTQFVEFVGELPFVTYNAAFDIGFLINTYRRYGRTLTNKYDCALKRARRAIPGLPNYKLAYISMLLKLPQSSQHRALADCERAFHVYLISTLRLNRKVRWLTPST